MRLVCKTRLALLLGAGEIGGPVPFEFLKSYLLEAGTWGDLVC